MHVLFVLASSIVLAQIASNFVLIHPAFPRVGANLSICEMSLRLQIVMNHFWFEIRIVGHEMRKNTVAEETFPRLKTNLSENPNDRGCSAISRV
jgi:hypothetical protein